MSSTFTVHQARPPRKPKPAYARPRPTARGARAVTRINPASRAMPRIRAAGRMSVKEEEPSGAQRWLSMVDANEDEDIEELILELVPETNDFIATVEDALNFISVMGPTRSGKSTLMNLLAECKEKELFPTAGGGISFTKGIDLGNKIMTVEEFSKADGGQEVTPIVPGQQIGFLDTEGQGDQGDNYDISLFTPAILCSRIVIFNTKEVAKDYLLSQLALMTTIAQRIKLDDEEEDPENPRPRFGELVIVINQYTLGDSVEIVKQNILGQESGASDAVKRRNRIRTMLYALFEDVNLYILRGNQLKPGVEEDLESGVKKFLLLSDFLPIYVAEFLNLRTIFSEKLRHPRLVAQESMSGQSVAGLVPAIVEAINSEDPLDIPDLWEQTQTAAILKASLVFRDAFRASCDAVLQSADLLSTAQVGALLGPEIDRLLYEMERSLSYIPVAKIAATRAILSEEALLGKQNTLEHNLVRIKSEAQIELTKLISALPQHLYDEFPHLVSEDTATTKMQQLKARLFAAYQTWVTGYDPAGYPEGYWEKFETAYQAEQKIMLETIKLGWIQWVVTKDEETLQAVKTALGILTAETPLGELAKWKQGAEALRADTLLKYNGLIDASYLWTDPAAVKEAFVIKLAEIIAVAEENFKQDEEAIKQLIEAALVIQVQSFQNYLMTALTPRKEPGDYNTLIDRTVYRTILEVLMATSNISEGLTQYYLLEFETRTVPMISKFSDDYSKAAVAFIAYLDGELDLIVPHKLGDFQLLADQITIHKDLAKTELRSLLDSQTSQVLATFDNDMLVFAITQDAGQLRIDGARRDLEKRVDGHRGTKLALLQDAVNKWNRERLNVDTQPVLTAVVDFTIDTIAKLETAITRARAEYWGHASGDEADKVLGWSSFESQTTGLRENVRRATALFIGNVNATDGSTSEMEKIVLDKIFRTVASTANMLGMSWIVSTRQFLIETNDNGEKGGRSHLYKNQPVSSDGYMWDKPTSMKFHKWRVEFSEFRFDEPIIQELVPFTINSYTPPPQPADFVTTVAFSQSQREVITNTNSTMLKFDVEVSSSAGLEGVASTTVKTAFGGSGTFTDTKSNEIGFNIDFSTPITCPANRTSEIHHLGFKQKMSMTYTAKVKIVPSATFTGGFTVWGGGPYWDGHDRPNYHKQYTGQRHEGDIDTGYTDMFKTYAAADSDPWAWRACISKHSQVQSYVNTLANNAPYEIYVRGKWEGINGWKHVIMHTVSVPGFKAV